MKTSIHYVLILDQSGSMSQLKELVISSYNEQIDLIKSLVKNNPKSSIRITLCVFNSRIDFPIVDQNVDHISKLTGRDYNPASYTALYDAIGTSFEKISGKVKPKDKVFFAIFTDGLENASKEYTEKDISHKLEIATSNSWNIKFFCRYEERSFYKSKLNMPDECFSDITMDKKGINSMRCEITNNLEMMIIDDKVSKENKVDFEAKGR